MADFHLCDMKYPIAEHVTSQECCCYKKKQLCGVLGSLASPVFTSPFIGHIFHSTLLHYTEAHDQLWSEKKALISSRQMIKSKNTFMSSVRMWCLKHCFILSKLTNQQVINYLCTFMTWISTMPNNMKYDLYTETLLVQRSEFGLNVKWQMLAIPQIGPPPPSSPDFSSHSFFYFLFSFCYPFNNTRMVNGQ